MATSKEDEHPLRTLFQQKRYTTTQGMNWLQSNGYVSDNCIDPEDVARCDAERVLYRGGWSRERIAKAFDNLTPRHLIVGYRPQRAPYLVTPNQDSRNERYSQFDKEQQPETNEYP
jgi:hypothetical protein